MREMTQARHRRGSLLILAVYMLGVGISLAERKWFQSDELRVLGSALQFGSAGWLMARSWYLRKELPARPSAHISDLIKKTD
jgi:hypothetical protein